MHHSMVATLKKNINTPKHSSLQNNVKFVFLAENGKVFRSDLNFYRYWVPSEKTHTDTDNVIVLLCNICLQLNSVLPKHLTLSIAISHNYFCNHYMSLSVLKYYYIVKEIGW